MVPGSACQYHPCLLAHVILTVAPLKRHHTFETNPPLHLKPIEQILYFSFRLFEQILYFSFRLFEQILTLGFRRLNRYYTLVLGD